MDQNLHGCSPDRVKRTEHIQGIGGTEAEDGLAFVQHNEGLWAESCVRSGLAAPRFFCGESCGVQLLSQSPRTQGARGRGLKEAGSWSGGMG